MEPEDYGEEEHVDPDEENDGDDCADEMVSGETDDEEEERDDFEEETDDEEEKRDDSEDGSGSYYRPIERLQCHACRGRVRLSSSR